MRPMLCFGHAGPHVPDSRGVLPSQEYIAAVTETVNPNPEARHGWRGRATSVDMSQDWVEPEVESARGRGLPGRFLDVLSTYRASRQTGIKKAESPHSVNVDFVLYDE